MKEITFKLDHILDENYNSTGFVENDQFLEFMNMESKKIKEVYGDIENAVGKFEDGTYFRMYHYDFLNRGLAHYEFCFEIYDDVKEFMDEMTGLYFFQNLTYDELKDFIPDEILIMYIMTS